MQHSYVQAALKTCYGTDYKLLSWTQYSLSEKSRVGHFKNKPD